MVTLGPLQLSLDWRPEPRLQTRSTHPLLGARLLSPESSQACHARCTDNVDRPQGGTYPMPCGQASGFEAVSPNRNYILDDPKS